MRSLQLNLLVRFLLRFCNRESSVFEYDIQFLQHAAVVGFVLEIVGIICVFYDLLLRRENLRK